MTPDITPATSADLDAIFDLLDANKLPRAGLEEHVASTLALGERRGVRTVYLLTETAAQFFPKFGFRAITRAEVDQAVMHSPEFTTACPKTALVMTTSLTPDT